MFEPRITRQEVGEAAGHLLAELHNLTDDFRHGRIPQPVLEERVKIIRTRAKSFESRRPLASATMMLLVD